MSCNPLYVSAGLLHPCSGAEEYGCEIAWACTGDGGCEGSSRCSDCLSEDLASMSPDRADSYLDALERQSDNNYGW
jgi:hypothetical protein